MSVDAETVRRIAHLARIAVAEEEVGHLQGELNAILAFVEQLREVDVTGVEPMTSVTPMKMKMRADAVTDGGKPEDILSNAPASEDGFFLVPKVIELCASASFDHPRASVARPGDIAPSNVDLKHVHRLRNGFLGHDGGAAAGRA